MSVESPAVGSHDPAAANVKKVEQQESTTFVSSSTDKPDMGASVLDDASHLKGKTGIRRVTNAFYYSCQGLQAAWRTESAFRQEALLAMVLVPLACVLNITGVERSLLIITVMLVIIVELLNSAVEAAIDRIGMERHKLSGQAKDLGSAAVLVALLLAASVWGMVLWGAYQSNRLF